MELYDGDDDMTGQIEGVEVVGAEYILSAESILVYSLMHVKCIHELCTLFTHIPIIFASYKGYINVLS